jgi:DNA repair protein RecN (Recombination protein N)
MENAQFEVHLESAEPATEGHTKVYVEIGGKKYISYSWGIDKIEFYISTNKGESPKPLAKVASGGEISRIMLALKSVLSHSDKIPTLVFDEIDTGISGRIAQKVGKAMKILGKDHQVISITHLGQIAAFADRHYIVEKKSTKSSTTASIRQLTEDEHQAEIARLIAGETLSPESLEAARALKKEADELVS